MGIRAFLDASPPGPEFARRMRVAQARAAARGRSRSPVGVLAAAFLAEGTAGVRAGAGTLGAGGVALPPDAIGVGRVLPADRAALAEDLGLSEPDPEPIDADPARLDAVAGRYLGQLSNYELVREGEGLVLVHHPKGGFPTADSPPPPAMPRIRARFSALDRLLFLDAPLTMTEADVHWNGDRPDWVRIGHRVCRREF
jgi:hypothetical protein